MAMLMALLSAFVVGIGLVMGAYVAITKLPGYLAQRKLQGRLEELSAPIDEPGDTRALVKVSEAGPLPALERMISGTERGSALSRWIAQSGMKVSISGVLIVAALIGGRLRVPGDLAHPLAVWHSGVASPSASRCRSCS